MDIRKECADEKVDLILPMCKGADLLSENFCPDINPKVCGKCYCKDYLDYIYVDAMGGLIKPNFLTQHFDLLLKKHDLKKIRFHDLRHSCASLFYANGVALKDTQEWHGHSDIGTPSNIYTHLDYSSKVSSANAILSAYSNTIRVGAIGQ